jgi:hypothetical protein
MPADRPANDLVFPPQRHMQALKDNSAMERM